MKQPSRPTRGRDSSPTTTEPDSAPGSRSEASNALGLLRGPPSSMARRGVPSLQRSVGNRAVASLIRPGGSAHTTQLGEGVPLAPGMRGRLERSFGTPLGHVEVHRGASATSAVRQKGVDGFAEGSHVVLGDRWSPGSPWGDLLLAHEVAHVVQQSTDTGASREDQRRSRQTGRRSMRCRGGRLT